MNGNLTLQNKDEILSRVKNGFAIFWLKNSIEFARVKESKFEFFDREFPAFDEILNFRVFNQDREIYVFRQNSELKYRVKKDESWLKGVNFDDEKKIEDNLDFDYIDEEITLLGSDLKPLNNGFYELLSKSGSKFIIPLSKIGGKNIVKIKKRNYLETHPETSQVYYVDFRLSDIKGF